MVKELIARAREKGEGGSVDSLVVDDEDAVKFSSSSPRSRDGSGSDVVGSSGEEEEECECGVFVNWNIGVNERAVVLSHIEEAMRWVVQSADPTIWKWLTELELVQSSGDHMTDVAYCLTVLKDVLQTIPTARA
jgi:hypothetical protein